MSDDTVLHEECEKKINDAQTQIEKLTTERDEYLNGWKRAKADYVNFKNEQDKRGKDLASFASLALIAQCLPVLDHFRNAFRELPGELASSEWVRGIEHIARQLKDIFKNMGVEEYTDLVGKPFDAERHQAVGREFIETADEGSITQEVGAGYTMHGKVIQPARVIVNRRPDHLSKTDENEMSPEAPGEQSS